MPSPDYDAPGILAPWCPKCGWRADPRSDTTENYPVVMAEVIVHKADCPGRRVTE